MLSLWVYPNSWADVLALIDQLLFSLYLFLYSFAHSSMHPFIFFRTPRIILCFTVRDLYPTL